MQIKNLILDLKKLYENTNTKITDLEEFHFEGHNSPNLYGKNEDFFIYKKNYPLIDDILNSCKNDENVYFVKNNNDNKMKFELVDNSLENNLTDLFLGNDVNLKFFEMENIEKKFLFFLINKKMKKNTLFFRNTNFNYLNLVNSIERFENYHFTDNSKNIFSFIFITFLKTLKKKNKTSLNKIIMNLFGKDAKIHKNNIFIKKEKFSTLDFNFLNKIKTFIVFKNQFLKFLENFKDIFKKILKKNINKIIKKFEKINLFYNSEKKQDDLYFYKIFKIFDIKIPYHLGQINSTVEKLIKTFN